MARALDFDLDLDARESQDEASTTLPALPTRPRRRSGKGEKCKGLSKAECKALKGQSKAAKKAHALRYVSNVHYI